MATKPATLPRSWADNALYDSGPFIGSTQKVDPGVGIAASGHRPGAAFPTPAEYENYQQYHLCDWVRTWLYLGASTGAADAHIVEANGFGRSALVGLTLNDAVDETVLSVTGVNTLAPTADLTCTTGAVVVQANIGTSTGTGFSAPVGTGAGTGLSASLTASPVGATGLAISCDATTQGNGATITHAGTVNGSCLVLTSTTPDPALDVVTTGAFVGYAVRIDGGTRGLDITPKTTGIGAVVRSGSASNDGLQATLVNNTGFAVYATMPGTAGALARGVKSVAQNLGVAIEASSADGTAIIATASNAVAITASSTGTAGAGNYAASFSGDATSPAKGIIFMTPQNADPSAGGVSGALAMSTAKGLTLGNFSDGTWRSVWHSENGYACAFANVFGYGALGSTVPNAAFTAVAVIATANSGDQIKVAGATILIRLSFSMKSNSVSESFMSIRVEDTTAGGTIVWQRTGTGSADTAGYVVPANTATAFWVPGPYVEFAVAVPATGTRTYTVKMAAPTVVPFRIRDLTVAFVGTVA